MKVLEPSNSGWHGFCLHSTEAIIWPTTLISLANAQQHGKFELAYYYYYYYHHNLASLYQACIIIIIIIIIIILLLLLSSWWSNIWQSKINRRIEVAVWPRQSVTESFAKEMTRGVYKTVLWILENTALLRHPNTNSLCVRLPGCVQRAAIVSAAAHRRSGVLWAARLGSGKRRDRPMPSNVSRCRLHGLGVC